MKSFLLGKKTEVKTIPTARDYVQDGLLSLYDAKENAGWGVHDESSLLDLVGGLSVNKFGIGIVHGANFIDFTGSGMFDGTDYWLQSAFVEIVVDFADHVDVCFFNYNFGTFKFGRYRTNMVLTQSSTPGFGGVSFAGAMTYSFGTTSTRFINGSSWSTDSGDFWGASSGTSKFALGGTIRPGDVRAYSKGRFHCLRVYNRALTPAEVAANYAVDQRRFGI